MVPLLPGPKVHYMSKFRGTGKALRKAISAVRRCCAGLMKATEAVYPALLKINVISRILLMQTPHYCKVKLFSAPDGGVVWLRREAFCCVELLVGRGPEVNS